MYTCVCVCMCVCVCVNVYVCVIWRMLKMQMCVVNILYVYWIYIKCTFNMFNVCCAHNVFILGAYCLHIVNKTGVR